MPSLTVHNCEGKKVDQIDLPDDLFGGHVNKGVLYQAIVMYRANDRQGNVSTKERGQVSGGGSKPYRQKGTGQARVGSSRSPLMRGGGVTFGPHPRDFSYTVPKKIKRAALRESLKAKFITDNLLCVDRLVVKSAKTKDFVKILKSLKLEGKILSLSDEGDADIMKVSRNIRSFISLRAQDVNAYDILESKKLLVTKSAIKSLLKRIK